MLRMPTCYCLNRIDIQRQTATVKTDGTVQTTYATQWRSVSAGVEELSASEKERYGRDGSTAMYRFTIDRDLAVKESDRIVYGSLTLNILGVTNPSKRTRGRGRVIIAEEVR